jgi:hypothetical protein
MNLPRFVIVLPMVALTAIASAAEPKGASKLYKWVDEKGVTHYTQTLPGDVNQKGNTELDRRGRVVKKNDAALSEQQIQAIQDEKARNRQDEKRLEEQRRKDNALINTYTTEAEIDDSRNRAVGGALQEKQVETLKKAKRPVGEGFAEEIASHKADIARTEGEYKAKEAEIQRIRDRYDADKARFRELMSVGRK